MIELKDIKPSNNIVNIYVDVKDLRAVETKSGKTISVFTLGKHEFIINEKFVRLTKNKDKFSIGIKRLWNYPLFGKEQEVEGLNIIDYYFNLKKEEK